MNIFILDKDPEIAARSQCDRHVVKMILESAQMLSTAHRFLDGTHEKRPSKSGKITVNYWKLPDDRESILYKAVHVNHPCTRWARSSNENYRWLYEHFIALSDEYTRRYQKVHKTFAELGDILSLEPKNIDTRPIEPFALAMPDQFKRNDPVASYRDYYASKATQFPMKWTNSNIPEWIRNE